MVEVRNSCWSLLVICLLAVLLLNMVACTQSDTDTMEIDKEDREEIISLAKEEMTPCERKSARHFWGVEFAGEGKWLVIHECLEMLYRGSKKTPVQETYSHEEWYYYQDTGELVKQN